MSRWNPLGVALALLLLVAGPTTVGVSQAASEPRVHLNPQPLEVGDRNQTIVLSGEIPAQSTEFTIDVTPLADAGADLSGATVSVHRSTADVAVDAEVLRGNGRTEIRVTAAPSNGATDFRAELRLANVDTADVTPTELRYEGGTGERAVEHGSSFEVRRPGMPQLSRAMSPDSLVAGRQNETQRTSLILFDVPSDTTMALHVDLIPLRNANVSLEDGTVTAEPVRGGDVVAVERNGSTVELTVKSRADDRLNIAFWLTGLDTSTAEAASNLTYLVEVTAPAGTASETTNPFSVHRPGDQPTRTATPYEDPTSLFAPSQPSPSTAPPASDTGSSGFPGPEVVGAALTVLLSVLAGGLGLWKLRT